MYFLFLKAIHLGQMKDKFVGIFNGHDLYENELIRAQLYTIHRSLEWTGERERERESYWQRETKTETEKEREKIKERQRQR